MNKELLHIYLLSYISPFIKEADAWRQIATEFYSIIIVYSKRIITINSGTTIRAFNLARIKLLKQTYFFQERWEISIKHGIDFFYAFWTPFMELGGHNLPQFNGHFKKYTEKWYTMQKRGCAVKGKQQRFSREFKLEAVRLLEEGKKPAAELARELGIRRNQLYKWKEYTDKRGGSVFPRARKTEVKRYASRRNQQIKAGTGAG